MPFKKTSSPLPILTSVLILSSAIPSESSELRLRKAVVIAQSDRALVVAHGKFDHVKSTVNGLADDCDLHAPVRVDEIKVAVVGEFENACSTNLSPADVSDLTKDAPQEYSRIGTRECFFPDDST